MTMRDNPPLHAIRLKQCFAKTRQDCLEVVSTLSSRLRILRLSSSKLAGSSGSGIALYSSRTGCEPRATGATILDPASPLPSVMDTPSAFVAFCSGILSAPAIDGRGQSATALTIHRCCCCCGCPSPASARSGISSSPSDNPAFLRTGHDGRSVAIAASKSSSSSCSYLNGSGRMRIDGD